jgi:hypothetical protein
MKPMFMFTRRFFTKKKAPYVEVISVRLSATLYRFLNQQTDFIFNSTCETFIKFYIKISIFAHSDSHQTMFYITLLANSVTCAVYHKPLYTSWWNSILYFFT